MEEEKESEPEPMKNATTVERESERELVVTPTLNGPELLDELLVALARP
jgi:hypothetical protein